MQLTSLLPAILLVVAPVSLIQWWAMRLAHRKDLAAARSRYLAAQQTADTMLQQARRQYAQIQQELAALRQGVQRPNPPKAPFVPAVRAEAGPPAARAKAREDLMSILDEGNARQRALPVDGFASTMPSQQFPATTSFGTLGNLLHRTSVHGR